MQFINKLTNNSQVRKYFLIALIGSIISVSIYYFLVYSEFQDEAFFDVKAGVLSAFSGVLIAFLLYKSAKFLNKILPWQTQTGNRLFVGFLLHFCIAYIVSFLLFYGYDSLFINTENFRENNQSILIKLAIVLLLVVLIFEVIYFALYSYYSYANLQIEIVKQERKQIELQLTALKSQLSPHFLFNSLNTISSLIYKDENKAENFIRKLAKMYDFTLKSYHQKLITLREELGFVTSYIYLIQTRFENKFDCIIDISEDLLETKIPPLTLQMLVENAVKHNQLSEEKPLLIKITSSKNSISVENNITKKPLKITSFNIGLKNINSRYLLLSNQSIVVSHSEKFEVKIPVI